VKALTHFSTAVANQDGHIAESVKRRWASGICAPTQKLVELFALHAYINLRGAGSEVLAANTPVVQLISCFFTAPEANAWVYFTVRIYCFFFLAHRTECARQFCGG
jgi:hypothetical protein